MLFQNANGQMCYVCNQRSLHDQNAKISEEVASKEKAWEETLRASNHQNQQVLQTIEKKLHKAKKESEKRTGLSV